ncbi:MAG: ACP S-malonyltransferase [Gammaproteobacteria bacterium]|nr:ACP S-malonyltransferase [Gammaproteobacteria bacterium]
MRVIAIVFPGQGSQFMGMLQAWAQEEPLIQATFSQASEKLGYDLWALTQIGPEEKLNQTEFTQPALLAAGVALYRVLVRHLKTPPSYLAGHSLGEYTALVCANAIAFDEAIKLVEMRGRFMQRAVPVGKGAMAAIVGLSAQQVESVCAEISTPQAFVAPANYNADFQVVIAGDTLAVEKAMTNALTQGAKLAKKLLMSVPSHCLLMKPAAEQLKKYLENISIQQPTLPVIHNVDVAVHTTPGAIRTALVEQLYRPVCWTQTMKQFTQNGVDTLIECGPGKVLTGLGKRIADSPQHTFSMSAPEELQKILAEVK